jgi:hypothetical protein
MGQKLQQVQFLLRIYLDARHVVTWAFESTASINTNIRKTCLKLGNNLQIHRGLEQNILNMALGNLVNFEHYTENQKIIMDVLSCC